MVPTMLYVPVEVAAKPMTGHAWVDYWWMCDPEKGLMWWTSNLTMDDVRPQCNPDREIVDRMIKRESYNHCIALQVPVVFNAHAVRELRSLRDQTRMFNTLSKDWTA